MAEPLEREARERLRGLLSDGPDGGGRAPAGLRGGALGERPERLARGARRSRRCGGGDRHGGGSPGRGGRLRLEPLELPLDRPDVAHEAARVSGEPRLDDPERLLDLLSLGDRPLRVGGRFPLGEPPAPLGDDRVGVRGAPSASFSSDGFETPSAFTAPRTSAASRAYCASIFFSHSSTIRVRRASRSHSSSAPTQRSATQAAQPNAGTSRSAT